MRAFSRVEAGRFGTARLSCAALALCVAAFSAAAPAAAQSNPETIRIQGSSVVGASLMPTLIKGYVVAKGWGYRPEAAPGGGDDLTISAMQGDRATFAVSLRRGDSKAGIKGLIDGEADIAMASRIIEENERGQLETGGVNMRGDASEHVVALDGLSIIVSELNPQLTITREEIAKIFSGEITDWSDLGQTARPIVVHAGDDATGAFATFEALALRPFGKKLAAKAKRSASNVEIVSKVAADPNAIGFVPMSFAKSVRSLALSLDCGLIVSPDPFSVKTEEYPLGRRLHLYTKGSPPSEIARELLAFAKSDQAQPIVASEGFIDQTLDVQSAAAFSNHLVSAMGLAKSAEESRLLQRLFQLSGASDRLSLTFRFAPGGQDILDAKSTSDAARLLRWMARNQGAKVLLMGFGGDGEAARLRAEAARRAILIFAQPGFRADLLETHGFGSVAPVACPPGEGETDRNVRVEVWVARRG